MNVKIIKITALYVLAQALLLAGCTSSDDTGSESNAAEAVQKEAVRVMDIEYREIARSVSYTAHLEGYKEVYLASASPGRISRIGVEVGDHVTRGQLIVEMDQTQLNQAKIQLQSLEVDYKRMDTLRKLGSISQQQFDQVKTQYDLARSNVEFLQENTQMLAPFSGTVMGKYYEDGEMFSGAPNTPVGKAAILSLVETSRLKVFVDVAERFYPNIKEGMEAIITSDVYPGENFSGVITTIYPTIDKMSRSFKIEISLSNADKRLRPGMFARAQLELDQVQAFVVPSVAIMKLQGSNERFVFLEENGKAKRMVVELGDRYDDMVELISDEVHESDKLIIAGQARLLDGMPVEISR